MSRLWKAFQQRPWPVLAGAALLGAGLLPLDRLPTACWFKRLLGLPCPACGLTHSVGAALHGRWAEAWDQNPFGFVFLPLALLLLAWPLLERSFPALADERRQRRWVHWGSLALAFSLLAFGAWRIWNELAK